MPFTILNILIPVIAIIIFITTFVVMISPKFRAKILGQQIKSLKYMIEDNKDDIESLITTSSETAINSKKKVLDKNEKTIKEIHKKEANTEEEAIEIKARALKKGLTNTKYCKYCGKGIDEDSIYCKECGKKQN